MFKFSCIVFSCSLGVFLASAQTGLTGPSLGFVFDDSAQAVRPIFGVPGAATIGAPVDFGGSAVVAAAVSPHQDYVLAFLADSTMALLRSKNGVVTVEHHPEISAVPDLIGLSPSGASAALFYRQNANVQVLTGLPDSLTVAANLLDISALPDSLDNLTITDDGSALLGGFPENTAPGSQSGEVYLIPADGSAPRSLLQIGHASALSLFNQSQDLLVTDDTTGLVYRISGVTASASVSPVLSGMLQIAAPSGIIASPDDQMIFVSGPSGSINGSDFAGQNSIQVQCLCQPTELKRLMGGNAYQLTELSDGVVWMLYWDPNNPRTLFIPSAWTPPATSSSTPAAALARKR